MRGRYKSKKMLFFIVLLFVIVQIITIIGMADETDCKTEDSNIKIATSSKVTLTPGSIIKNIKDALEAIEPKETSTAIQKVLKIEEKAIIEEGENSETEADFSSNEMTTTETTTLKGGDTASTKTTSVTENGGSSSSSENAPKPSSGIRSGSSGSGSSSRQAPISNMDSYLESDDVDENVEKTPETDRVSPNDFLLIKENFAITFTPKKSELSIETSDYVNSGNKLNVVVTDLNGKPIEGVEVTFLGKSVTNEDGVTEIGTPKLSEDTKTLLTIAKDGFLSASTYIVIKGVKPKEFGPPYIERLPEIPELQNILDTDKFPFIQ